MREHLYRRACCALLLCAAIALAACGGGEPLPDCVPPGFVGPLPEGTTWCDGRVPTPRVDCTVPGMCG